MGGLYRVTLELKKAIERDILVGPRLVVAGRPLTITGGHLWQIGLECDGVDEVRKAVRQVMKDGSDFVKIFATSGGTPGTERARFNVEELKVAADEANRFGKRIVCHALNREGILNALEAGVDEIVHLSFGYQDGRSSVYETDVGERIANLGVSVSFTLRTLYKTVKDLEKKKKAQNLSPPEQDTLTSYKTSLENQFTSFRELRKLGVKIAAGDDAGWSSLITPYITFDGLVDELEAFTVAGMTPLEAITSATKTSAEFIGLNDILGTIEVGKIADILVVRGEPFQNIEDLRNVQMVLKEGKVVHRKLD
jgi:imidazolonepropionase-like amidohydrolase